MRAPTPTCLDVLCHSVPAKLESDLEADSSNQTSPSLSDLPPELLTAIYALVDCRSVVRCRSVCRLLKDVVDASLELQYRIELARDGMIDGPGSRPSTQSPLREAPTDTPLLTISDRLTRLRQLRQAWKTLSWTRCMTVPMPGLCCAYELVGGVFCKTQPKVRRGRGGGTAPGVGPGFGWNGNGHGHGHAGGGGDGDGDEEEDAHIEAPWHAFGSRTMSATWLPGRHGPGRTVVKDDLGIATRDFAMDPSQDLMVLFKGGGEDAGLPVTVAFPGMLELHIRTISTNQTHPEARVPLLFAPVMYPVTSAFIQIVDDVVGMMYCVDPSRPRITIWNWKTGDLVVDRSGGNLPPGTWDFSFIHSRALFVTTSNNSGSLGLFTFTCDRADTDTNGSAHSGTDSDSSTPTQPRPHYTTPTSHLDHVATLHLPSIHPTVRMLNIGSHTGPFLASCPPDKPFVASNEERIHVLTIQYIHLPTLDGPRTRPRVCVFVHNRALERYLERGVARAAMSTGEATAPMVVPWSEWGQVHTRMVPHVGMFQWLRYVHGQRVVMLLPTSEAGKSTLRVLDFNVRSALDDDEGEDDGAGAGVDVGHTGDGTSISGDKKDEVAADLSLRKTTLEYINNPTRIVMPNIFVDIVESELPYREARRDVRGDYSGIMIDDERLVGLKYPAFLTGDMKEIDIFTM